MTRELPDPWPDERLDAAFRARFDADPPSGLARTLLDDLRTASPRSRRLGWVAAPRGWAALPLAGVAALGLMAILASAMWVGTPRPPVPGSGGPGSSPGPSGAAGTPWPAEITIPGSAEPQPVLSVPESITVRDTQTAAREIVVGGWYAFNPVPCGVLPDANSPLEDCGVDFTWLMASPENLRIEGLGNEGSRRLTAILRPHGPAINPVLAIVDWAPPTDGQPTPVVFAGHFRDSRASDCPEGDRRARCEDRFVVDAVLWASGVSNDIAAAPPSVFGLPHLFGLPDFSGLPVISVDAAITVRDGGSATEVAVEGWYQAPLPTMVFSCPAQTQQPVPILQPHCAAAFSWLMAEPESLITASPGGTQLRPPTGAAVQSVFGGVVPPALPALTTSGTSIPTKVVLVGHFNDRRATLCPADQQAACLSRFVVDGVAWISSQTASTQVNDLRDPTGPLPTPEYNPRQNFIGLGTILSEVVVSGEQVGQIEPGLTRAPTDLSAEPSLWIVTALEPDGSVRTVVFTTSCAVYQYEGPDFVPVPHGCRAEFP